LIDPLKNKEIMVWTFMGNARMYEALDKYGDPHQSDRSFFF